MKDKDFDNIFSRKMGQLSGPAFQEDSWADLSSRLNAHHQRRRSVWIPLWLLIGLLTAGNIFWWSQWRALAANQGVQNRQNTLVQRNDTLVNQTIVYRYDTIYQYVTRTRLVYQPTETGLLMGDSKPDKQKTNTTLSDSNTATDFTNPNTQDAITLKDTNFAKTTLRAPISTDIPTNSVVPKVDTSAHKAIASTPPESAKDTVQTQLTIPITKVTRSPVVYFARPRAGLMAGWSNLQFAGKRGGTAPPISFGVQGDIEIAQKFRVEGAVLFSRTGAKSDSISVLNGHANIPNPGADYTLRYWEVYNLQSLSYSLSVRYDLPKWRALCPYLGVGGQAATFFPYHVEYEFRNANDYLEVNALAFFHPKTSMQGLLFKLGAEGTIKPNWVIGAETFWLHGLAKNRHFLDRQWGINIKLLHLF